MTKIYYNDKAKAMLQVFLFIMTVIQSLSFIYKTASSTFAVTVSAMKASVVFRENQVAVST